MFDTSENVLKFYMPTHSPMSPLQKPTLTNDTKDTDYIPHDLPQRQSVQPLETCSIARRAKRMKAEVNLFQGPHK